MIRRQQQQSNSNSNNQSSPLLDDNIVSNNSIENKSSNVIEEKHGLKRNSSITISVTSGIEQQATKYYSILKVILFSIGCILLALFIVELNRNESSSVVLNNKSSNSKSISPASSSSVRGYGHNHKRTSEEATKAMLNQPSDYVDGEKKLKAELDKLAAYQTEGKYLGAIFKTRWDDNGPIWTTKDGKVVTTFENNFDSNTKSKEKN